MDVPDPPDKPSGEPFFRRLLDAATEVLIAVIETDGTIAYVNRASRWLLGYESEELVGRSFTEFVPAEEVSQALRKFETAKSGRPHFRQLATVRTKGGGQAQLRFDATPLTDDSGATEGIVFIGHDATSEIPATPRAAELQARGGREPELLERLPAISYVAEPGPEGRWRYVSPQVERMLGYPPEAWLEDPSFWARTIHPADRKRVLEEEERDPGTGGTEYRLVARDGHVVWVRDEAVLRTDPDGSPRYDGILTDITERKRFESRLQFFAEHDPLTGVFNRRRFVDELNAEIRRLRRFELAAALLMLDLDNLKEVNDSLGHRVGDTLIRDTARILTRRLRESDTVGRLGGDEFAVLLRGADTDHARRVAEELVSAIRERGEAIVGGHPTTAVSAGVASLRPTLGNADDALAAADRAMYEAKRKGGGRVETHVP